MISSAESHENLDSYFEGERTTLADRYTSPQALEYSAVGCFRVGSRRIPNCVREVWYGLLLDIGHHTILGQMEIVQSHTRIALSESLTVTALATHFTCLASRGLAGNCRMAGSLAGSSLAHVRVFFFVYLAHLRTSESGSLFFQSSIN